MICFVQRTCTLEDSETEMSKPTIDQIQASLAHQVSP
jgi:hypothetical protein